ncbi:MAG: hypothetical protein ABIM30_00700 [candidate division WOR-3 bacterium]
MAEEKKIYPLLQSHQSLRENIVNKAINYLKNNNVIEAKLGKIVFKDINAEVPEYSLREEKNAILGKGDLMIPIKGTIELHDNEGNVLDRRKGLIIKVPYITSRNTFIIGGNEYVFGHMLRMLPGVFLHKKGNEIESKFNLAKGRNFTLHMDQEGLLTLSYGTQTKIPAYPLFKILGASDDDIARFIGKDGLKINAITDRRKFENIVEKIYNNLYPEHLRSHKTIEEKINAIREHKSNAAMDPDVNKNTIGHSSSSISHETLLHAAKRMIEINRSGVREYDDRNHLGYKRIVGLEDFVAERIKHLMEDIKPRINNYIIKKKDLDSILPSWYLTSGMRDFLLKSEAKTLATTYNPIDILDKRGRVSMIGEGGISDEKNIPAGARQLHISHFGILDPILTKESSEHSGIDVRAAIGAKRDEEGKLYATAYNIKTGKVEYIPAADIEKKVIGVSTISNFRNAKGKISGIKKGIPSEIDKNEVEYLIPPHALHGEVPFVIPFRNNFTPNRLLMGAKFVTQALPLVNPDYPLVSPALDGESTHDIIARSINFKSPVDGIVHKIDSEFIYIKPLKPVKEASEKDLIKIPHIFNMPLSEGSYVQIRPIVGTGEKVKAGQTVAEYSNLKGNKLTLGKNLIVSYNNYYGLNSNDAVVISESAAKKLTSIRTYRITIPKEQDSIINKDKFIAKFKNKYPRFDHIDNNGLVKINSKVMPGDILATVMKPTKMNDVNKVLGKISRSLINPYTDNSIKWDGEHPAIVTDVKEYPNHYSVVLRMEAPAQIGDKLAIWHGNKGVISKIIPDEQMMRTKDGKVIDVIFTPAGIISRMNPSQIYDAILGKIAAKTGKRYLIDVNHPPENMHEFVKNEMKKHGIKDKETVYDPVSGKEIPNVFVGVAHVLKLFKTTDTNYSAIGVGKYDQHDQPIQGGETGAKAIGRMELDALFSHNIKNYINDIHIKGNRNDEFWRAVQLGLPFPKPAQLTSYNKFNHLLNTLGIKLHKEGNIIKFMPLTDKEILNMSAGEVKEPLMVSAKHLSPERDGLFDYNITGGLNGTKFAHISLHERMPNPIFEEPIKMLLGINTETYNKIIKEEGGEGIYERLKKVNLDAIEENIKKKLKQEGTLENKEVKTLRLIKAIKEHNIKPHEHYVISAVPVMPPISRPVAFTSDGMALISGFNYLYRDIIIANNGLKEVAISNKGSDTHKLARMNTYKSIKALFGLDEPISEQAKSKNVKGIINFLGSPHPKTGFINAVMMYKPQALSGRATITPNPQLHMDEIEVPESMLWTMFEPFIMRRLVQKGIKPTQAKEMIKNKHPTARDALNIELKTRPVIYNRAPSLHRFNLIAGWAKPTSGKSFSISPHVEGGLNADFDGDTFQIHVPVTPKAVEDARSILPSNLFWGDKNRADLMMLPKHEAVWGLYRASVVDNKNKPTKVFKNKEEVYQAWKRGEVDLGDRIEIKEK